MADNIQWYEGQKLLEILTKPSVDSGIHYVSDPANHRFEMFDANGLKTGVVRMPPLWQKPLPEETLSKYLSKNEILQHNLPYTILLMQAGQAALGFVSDNELVYHKTIRKYMVRKKQGKVQLKHLNTKGKSRAGSRIRLAQSVIFFEEVNEKLTEWQCIPQSEKILYGASMLLWPYLFQSKVPCPFDQHDVRLSKMHLSLPTPGLEQLNTCIKFANMGFIHRKKPVHTV